MGSGISFALLAFCGFPISDAIMKSMAGEWPASALVAVRFSISAVGLAILLLKLEGFEGFKVKRPWLHAARGLMMALAAVSFISAIFIMPLADAVAISFMAPIITALLSSIFLKEKMRPVTWMVTFVAFGGVLIMLRPNVVEFGWAAALPLVAATAMSVLMIFNRMVSSQRSVTAAQFYGSFWTSIFMILIALAGHGLFPPMEIVGVLSLKMLVLCTVVAVLNTGCHFLLYVATMRSTAAAVAPIMYVQLIISSLISIYIFGDSLDPLAVLGGVLIVLSGMVLWNSERKMAPSVRA
ncbi:MAG: DMT family transporter [Parasphingorhabdus sp.]